MANERARGAPTRSLVNQAQSYTLSYNYGTPGQTAGGNGAGWFGPLQPMHPIAPPDVKGRILDYQSGYNLISQARAGSIITFDMLRNFADAYDLLRLLIETRKDQMSRLTWNIQPRDKKLRSKGATLTGEMEARIAKVVEFFLMPDKENFWDDWLRMLLEDLFVLDAPTVYIRRTIGGELYALQPIDGGTIKRVIDDWGNTPEAPDPAYQQILKGYPAVNYTTDELVYRPRNKRTHKIYGYSPVEQMLMTINIGMRREAWQLESFTEGNIPEALIGTPSAWTPDQVRQFQDWFDSMLQGNTGQKRKARFVPGEVAKSYVPTKPSELFGEAEEWLIRVMCFCFGVSPQPFVKMMNRATAESAQESAAMDGLAPIQNWVRGLMNFILIKLFNAADLEFVWEEDDELDPDKKSMIIDREQAAGRLTYNEARREQGLGPDPHPNADRAMTLTAEGWVPIFLTPEEEAEKEAMTQALKDAAAKPPGEGGDDDPPKPGEEDDDASDTPLAAEEVAEKSDLPFHQHGPGCGHHLTKADAGTDTDYPDPLRPLAAKAEKKLTKSFEKAFAKLLKEVTRQVKAAWLKLTGVTKADETPDEEIERLVAELDLSALAMTQDDLVEYLSEIAADSGRIALSQMGMEDAAESIVDKVNDRAVAWAEIRAAELVSFKDVDPLLAQTTRDMIRGTITQGMKDNLSMPKIGEALKDSYGFSAERAHVIAATEITGANSNGSLESFKEVRDSGGSVKKSWLRLGDACPICVDNAGAGAIELEEEFPSGDQAPGAHPYCRCVLVPEVEDD